MAEKTVARKRRGKRVLRVVPLGGAGEIGKNCVVVEYNGDLVVIDAGVMFPSEEMHGVDLVIPDFSYIIERAANLRGIVLSHGHEDHIGSLPYLLRQLGQTVPIFGSPLTLGLARAKLREHGVLGLADMRSIAPREMFKLGTIQGETYHVSHSIPDSRGVVLHTPLGVLIYTSDFKFDPAPLDGLLTDTDRLAELGDEGVLFLLSDSTRAERAGRTPSETSVGETLERLVAEAPGRVIVTTFASNVARLGQVITAARKYGRKVAIVGRSMEQTLGVAAELNYLKLWPDTVRPLSEIKALPSNQVVMLTTGSQGEPTSVLSRIAMGDYPQIRIMEGDTVIVAANPVPGNETTVSRTIDNLFRRGARVIYGEILESVHVSGHAGADELRAMIELTQPRRCVPIHGEYRQLISYRQMALSAGIAPENIYILDNGNTLEFDGRQVRTGGQVPVGSVLVDGLTVGHVTKVVLHDRSRLATEGVVVVAVTVDRLTGDVISGPDLMARGLVSPAEEDLLELAKPLIARALKRTRHGEAEYGFLVHKVRQVVGQLIRQRTGTQPLILPVVMEV
ncbi:MAG: ribonuclease J [Chloroflexota bacterium]|nr:MAG: ribonuclease J [Chloroflexota bacterium]